MNTALIAAALRALADALEADTSVAANDSTPPPAKKVARPKTYPAPLVLEEPPSELAQERAKRMLRRRGIA